MVAESAIAFVFATIGLVSTMILIGLATVALTKLDDLRAVLDPADESASGTDVEADPLETLRERYARGDLTDEEFERKTERLLETDRRSAGATEPAFETE